MTEFLYWCVHEWIQKQRISRILDIGWIQKQEISRILDIYIYILLSSSADLYCSPLCIFALYIDYHVMWTSTTSGTFLQSMQGPIFFWNIWLVQYVMFTLKFMSTIYSTCWWEIYIYFKFLMVNICVTDHMFLCSKLYALPQGESVARAKIMCYKDNYCNTW